MRVIAGSIIMLASALCALAGAIALTSPNFINHKFVSDVSFCGFVLFVIGFVVILIGLFTRDNPKS